MANRQSLQREEFNSSEMGEPTLHPPIVGFATRLKLPESKRKRKRALAEPVSPRPKSEEELREEAAWKQVEETGRPVVFDQHLLIPEGMTVWQAIEFLPDGVREPTKAALGAKVSEAWQLIFHSTEQQIRKDMEAKGNLERYNSLPSYARNALTESVVRAQWKLPQVPLEELLQQWENPPKEEEKEFPPKKKKRRAKESKPMVEEDLSIALNETRLEGAPVTVEPAIDQIQAPSEGKPSQTGSSSPTAIEWNQEHHRFLLKRIAQIWGYLNTEEQQAVQEILNRPISRQDIDQIDEIVKGVEWVRRLQK